jgi:hypothetical protein
MTARKALLVAAVAAAALTGCNRAGDIVVEQGVGITALRSVCPAVGVPDFTGDVTLFSPADARTADALDVTASLTNVRTQCDDTGDQVYATATFDVVALRRDTRGARTLQLPYFSTVIRGGNAVVAKRVGTVTCNSLTVRIAHRRPARPAPISTGPRRRSPLTSASGSPRGAGPAIARRRSTR